MNLRKEASFHNNDNYKGFQMTFTILFMMFVAGLMIWAIQRARKAAHARKERADFIRKYCFPAGLKYKLDQAFPDLTDEQVKLIIEGLRAWFLLIAGHPGRHFGMPSKAVDTAWHEFILLTKNYADFCDRAFGKFLHHAPHVGDAKAEADGLAWTWGSRSSMLGAGALAGGLGASLGVMAILSSKDLFDIDQKLGIAGGNAYSDADFEKFDKRHSQLASSSGDGGSSGATGGDSASCGDSGSCGDGGAGCGGGGGCGS